MRLILVLAFFFNSVFCQDPSLIKYMNELASSGNCAYYFILQSYKECGKGGYPIDYGLKYCTRFQDNRDKFTPDGQVWVTAVTKCLMNSLTPEIELSCDDLKKFAFSTHVKCYLNPGYDAKSFCEIISLKEIGNIIALLQTYELRDFFTLASLNQIKQVMYQCLINSAGPLAGSLATFLNGILNPTKEFLTNKIIDPVNDVLENLKKVVA